MVFYTCLKISSLEFIIFTIISVARILNSLYAIQYNQVNQVTEQATSSMFSRGFGDKTRLLKVQVQSKYLKNIFLHCSEYGLPPERAQTLQFIKDSTLFLFNQIEILYLKYLLYCSKKKKKLLFIYNIQSQILYMKLSCLTCEKSFISGKDGISAEVFKEDCQQRFRSSVYSEPLC